MFTRRAELHTPTLDLSTCWHVHTRRQFSHMCNYVLLLLFCFVLFCFAAWRLAKSRAWHFQEYERAISSSSDLTRCTPFYLSAIWDYVCMLDSLLGCMNSYLRGAQLRIACFLFARAAWVPFDVWSFGSRGTTSVLSWKTFVIFHWFDCPMVVVERC